MKKIQLLILSTVTAMSLNAGTALAVKVCYDAEAPLAAVSRVMGIKKCGKNQKLRFVRYRNSTYKKIENHIRRSVSRNKPKPRKRRTVKR